MISCKNRSKIDFVRSAFWAKKMQLFDGLRVGLARCRVQKAKNSGGIPSAATTKTKFAACIHSPISQMITSGQSRADLTPI